MPDASTEAVKALKMAIEIEDNGLVTFLKFARQTKHEFGKNMFIRLAMDENEHRRILEKQMHRLAEGQPWVEIQVPDYGIEHVAPTMTERQQKATAQSGGAETEALKIALDLERKAAKFFREQAEAAADPKARSLFEQLAEWEDAHFDLIQAEMDSINNTGYWFNVPEFKMDGKY
jgi:rubrerythrin